MINDLHTKSAHNVVHLFMGGVPVGVSGGVWLDFGV